MALALILFEGGHESRFEVLRENWKSCLGVIFPAFLIGAGFLRFFTESNLETSLVGGAILAGASPSVVVPLVKQLRMRRGPALVLMLETALADVLCLVLVPVLASLPLQRGWESGEMIQDLAYGIILFSILGCSLMVFVVESTPLGRLLKACFPG